MKDTIVLIGMPGSGKSTIGVVLAKALGKEFVDCDLVIQAKTKKLLHESIRELGPEGFLQLEDAIDATVNVSNAVIATGGSAVYGEYAMKHFGEIGTILYLKLSYEDICARLGNFAERGVVLRDGQDFKAAYEERCKLYERYADVTIDCKNQTIPQIVEAIKKELA